MTEAVVSLLDKTELPEGVTITHFLISNYFDNSGETAPIDPGVIC